MILLFSKIRVNLSVYPPHLLNYVNMIDLLKNHYLCNIKYADMELTEKLKEFLISEAERINTPDFITDDPVSFPHRFSDKRDMEIAGFFVAHIAWGNRKIIMRSAEKLLALMYNEPYRYVADGDFSNIDPTMNVHRTCFGEHLIYMLNGFREIYEKYGSLDDFCRSTGASASGFPAWELAWQMRLALCKANGNRICSRTIPLNLDSSALKRINMWLRWMVRDDGIVDLGIWESLRPSQLFIPLDVHVSKVSRELGLLTRKANDRGAAVALTEVLRTVIPEDPVKLDFALFGIGMEKKQGKNL